MDNVPSREANIVLGRVVSSKDEGVRYLVSTIINILARKETAAYDQVLVRLFVFKYVYVTLKEGTERL
jgi:hypothetical protein